MKRKVHLPGISVRLIARINTTHFRTQWGPDTWHKKKRGGGGNKGHFNAMDLTVRSNVKTKDVAINPQADHLWQ